MSWFNLWDGLKTKTCRYLLQRYLGQFFENNLNLEQLKVDLYNGKAVVENISLKVNALNELFEEQGWAFEVISGHIGCLTAMVPWNALMTNDSSLNISDLTITLRPVTRSQSGTTMLESMWSSVSSSMQMAEECMKQVDDDIPFLNHSNTLIGLEKFAETIDNVLNRIHANLTNTTLNIEYTLPTSFQKLIISFKANHVEYKNQTGYEKYTNLSKDPGIDIESEDRPQILTSLPMIARHQLVTNELTVWTSEIINNEVGSTGQENTGLLCKIVEFKGCQNFKISIKQTENIVGPKVNLEIIIDDIYFLLTPRQTHLLIRISKGFNKDRPKDIMVKQYKDIKTDISNIVPHPTKMTGFIKKGSEWSNEGDSRKSEHLLNDFKTTKNVESTIYATTANSMATSCSNTQINSGSSEKSGEILKFKIQIFKMLGVLLHNDILLENTITNNVPKYIITDKSFLNYSHIADAFFPSTRQKGSLEDGFTPILNHNYLLLMVSSLLVNGNQQRYYQELTLKTTLSATMVDFSEIIDNTPNHLIAFDRKKNCNNGYHIRPEVILSHTSSCLLKQNSNRCSNKVECFFDDCTTDLDISIYDRLSSLFGSSPFDKQSDCSDVILEVSNSMDIEIKCNLLKLHLRFPIVDGRLPVDPKKVPFWQKNIRNDYLSFDFQNILVKWNSILSVAIDEVDGFYCDMDFQNNIHFIKCSSRNILKNSAPVTETILVKVHNQDATRLCSENRQKQKRKSPFSSKCSYEYSSNVEGLHDSTDKREIFLPGDTEEINEFCESSKNSSGTTIYVFIPKVKIVLESKELYEIIYNRLNGDLFMWEPRSPIYKNLEPNNIDRRSNEGDFLINMDSKLHNKSLSDKTYANVHESTFYEKAILAKVNDMFSLELCVKEGNLIMFTDVPDVEKKEKQSSRGKLQFNLKEFRLFSVTGFNNDKNLGYFCVQLTEAELLHCELAWSDGVDKHLATAWSDNIDKHLNRIILKYSNDQLPINRNEMLSVVAELKKQPSKRLKRIKLAFGINSAIILHRTEYAAHNWIYQLIDFFNVAEFPIEAYEPFALVSEIQGHTWSLAIEYRPKSFPYRAFVDIGYCTLGSNIIYPMTGCTLRMLTEDCILSIGPVVESTGKCNESINCEGLIPVMNAGLLNISIRLSDESKIFPNIDLRSSIHDVHLKTCYDSADTLAQLIAYIANDKDLVSTDKKIDENKNNSRANWSKHGKDETLMHINKLMADAVKDAEISPTSYTSNKMKDTTKIHSYETASSRITSSSCNNSLDECNILNFEHNELLTACCPQEELENSLPQIDDELGATASNSVPTLEDFHFIHDNEIFFMDKCGIDEVFLSEDPLQIVDNHFCLPSEKKDLLRPPVHFPKSDESYTLCEMTFTWHLFGGMDFPELCAKPKTNGNTSSSPAAEMSDTYKQAVSHGSNESHKKSSKIILGKSKKSQRNSDVLVEIQLTKIRFSHDKYPTNSLYSSRQVLIIAEIEIRDRLISSDINKLLYHPFQNNIPQKNNENMITVKALNVRSNPNKQRANECSLKVSILPIRLNIDQDTLMFLEEFFSALIERSKNVSTTSPYDFDLYRDVPVMTVNGMSSVPNEFKATEIDRNSPEHVEDSTSKCNEPCEDSSASDPIYFKDFVFSPALPICFDYHGRRIELSRGPITGLVMGLAQLQGSGIILREVVNRRGLLGWNKLFEFLCKEWLKDIKRNQLPNILSGIGPTNAVLQLFQGFFDLFRLPLQQYNKDGRIIRGFQLGAQSFSARTAFAALEITSRIIHLLQFTAETTFDILSAGPSLNRRRKLKLGKRRQGRPKDIREGVANAYTIVKEGINESANTLMEAAVVEHDQKGYTGAVGAVVRQIPQLVVCPAVLATQATNNILGGAKSSLVPEAKREARNKWKHEKI